MASASKAGVSARKAFLSHGRMLADEQRSASGNSSADPVRTARRVRWSGLGATVALRNSLSLN